MNSMLTLNKLTKSVAGLLAMLATVVVIGAPLTIAEYYVQTGSVETAATTAFANESASNLPKQS